MKNIKQINGVPCVLGKVHMLATEKAEKCIIKNRYGALSYLSTGYVTQEYLKYIEATSHHLYITSNEEIKEGDRVIETENGNLISQFNEQSLNQRSMGCRKIIATTDPKLTNLIIQGESDYFNGNDGKTLNTNKLVSKISQQFIQDYCNKPVDEVWIEVEPIEFGEVDGEMIYDWDFKLTINSNNEVIIHNVEEKMYSRGEMEEKIIQLVDIIQHLLADRSIAEFDTIKWIEENL